MFRIKFSCDDPVCLYVTLPFFAVFAIALIWDAVLRSRTVRNSRTPGWASGNSIPQFQGKVGRRLGLVAFSSFFALFVGGFICSYHRCQNMSVSIGNPAFMLWAAVAGLIALALHFLIHWHRNRLDALEPSASDAAPTYMGIWTVMKWLRMAALMACIGLGIAGILID